MKTRENMQNRVQPPKTSPIEQITDRCEPKISPLRRVTLQYDMYPYNFWRKNCAFAAPNTRFFFFRRSTHFRIALQLRRGLPDLQNRNCSKFVTNSGVVDANFCANSAPDARVFGGARPTDSMQHFCDVKYISKRRRPKVWCVARRRTENLQTNLRIFCRKNCAISAPNARFFGAQHRAESHWSYAEVLRFKN